jgi:hypothetical protein
LKVSEQTDRAGNGKSSIKNDKLFYIISKIKTPLTAIDK